jgi:DNA-binding NtrC family response regulator
MNVFLAVFRTSLRGDVLAAQRRKLARILRGQRVRLVSLKVGDPPDAVLERIVREAGAGPVITLDDAHALPDQAPWMKDLLAKANALAPHRRPQLVYVSQQATAEGRTEIINHPLVRHYVERGNRDIWVGDAAKAALILVAHITAGRAGPLPLSTASASDVVGRSPVFMRAVDRLEPLLRSPYGLVTGDSGVGKILTICALWRRLSPTDRPVILPCGSFFKDYYVGGSLRRIGGGRETVRELTPYLKEADKGLLILHHVEQLPTALQEELDAQVSAASSAPKGYVPVRCVDAEGVVDCDVKIIATSTWSPDMLAENGRMIPDLLAKFRKRHVHIPSLEDRGPEDKRLLCRDILARIGLRENLPAPPAMDKAVVQALCGTFWRHNISDLVRALEYAVYRSGGTTIRMEHLPKELSPAGPEGPQTLSEVVAQAQRVAIQCALDRTGGSVKKAAGILGRNKSALHRLMRRLGLSLRR